VLYFGYGFNVYAILTIALLIMLPPLNSNYTTAAFLMIFPVFRVVLQLIALGWLGGWVLTWFE